VNDSAPRPAGEPAMDPDVDLVVDGNAIGGMLASAFGLDMTSVPGECANCHTVSVVGTLRVYMRGPGIVLRCPACQEIVMRIARTPRGIRVDARGLAYLEMRAG
jgi:hypothetical protein